MAGSYRLRQGGGGWLLSTHDRCAVLALGFGVGLLVGMTGVGGGSLMTPLLILLFGIHPATAVGTDLVYAAATKTGGCLVHGLARSIEWPVGRAALAKIVQASIP
jgi:uncharacterized membrane protein YfcA